MSNAVYLDYNATAPVKPDVIEAMAEAMAMVGNPSSVHAAGRAARRRVAQAREQVAALIAAPPDSIVFTSGGTEANNQALQGEGKVAVSAIEHPSVLMLADEECIAPVDAHGVIDLEALSGLLERQRPKKLAVMMANNETGVVQPVKEVAAIAREAGVSLHVDAVQAAGKIPIDFLDLGADFLSLSAHKLGGPQGVGALVVRPGIEPSPLLKGGAQEARHRPGTENLPGIVGFGEAAELALNDRTFTERVAPLRDQMEAEIKALSPETKVYGVDVPHGAGASRLPNTSCLTMPGVSHETQLIAFDLAGIAVSSGAACSSGKVGSSPVLAAMGVPDSEAKTAIRVSFGWASSKTDVERFVKVYSDTFQRSRVRREADGPAMSASGYG